MIKLFPKIEESNLPEGWLQSESNQWILNDNFQWGVIITYDLNDEKKIKYLITNKNTGKYLEGRDKQFYTSLNQAIEYIESLPLEPLI